MEPKDLIPELIFRCEHSESVLSNLANASAIIFETYDNVNWAGFYLMEDGKLKLGPFQGKPAVSVIEVGNGVCGTGVSENRTVVVDDVHEFCGHIACDLASKSEIVIPVYKNGEIFGVLDIDSPITSRFGSIRNELEEFVKTLENYI